MFSARRRAFHRQPRWPRPGLGHLGRQEVLEAERWQGHPAAWQDMSGVVWNKDQEDKRTETSIPSPIWPAFCPENTSKAWKIVANRLFRESVTGR